MLLELLLVFQKVFILFTFEPIIIIDIISFSFPLLDDIPFLTNDNGSFCVYYFVRHFVPEWVFGWMKKREGQKEEKREIAQKNSIYLSISFIILLTTFVNYVNSTIDFLQEPIIF